MRARRPHTRIIRSRWFLAAIVLLRVLGAIVALQGSGLPHFAIDALGLPDRDDDDCARDDANHGCPPGCPSCHDVCGTLASLPSSPVASLGPEPTVHESSVARALEDGAPPSAEIDHVYRPPRSTRSV